METLQTELDRAHRAMAEGGDAERLGFYAMLADTELTVWLSEEPGAQSATPHVLTVEGGEYVLAFDLEERLAALAQFAVSSMVVPGRVLANMLAGQSVGIALNIGEAPSAMLIPPEGVDWLVETLSDAAGDDDRDEQDHRLPTGFAKPQMLPASVLALLAARLSPAASRLNGAYLTQAKYDDGGKGLLLAIAGAEAQTQRALKAAVNEAAVFAGEDLAALDLVFLEGDSPALGPIRAASLQLDLTPPTPSPPPAPPAGPGLDPAKPPRLR